MHHELYTKCVIGNELNVYVNLFPIIDWDFG